MAAVRAALALLTAAALAACSPAAKPTGSSSSVTAPREAPTGARAWRTAPGDGEPLAGFDDGTGTVPIAFSCTPGEHKLIVIFHTLEEGEFGPQTATLRAGAVSVTAPVEFRSPEDAAKNDPPGWAGFAATPELMSALISATAIRVERSGKTPWAIDTGPANVALSRVLGACR